MPVLGLDEEAGEPREEVVEEAGQGGVPDDEDDQVDFLVIGRVEGDPFLRKPDRDGDLAVRVTRAWGRATPSPTAVLSRRSLSMIRVSVSFLLATSFCLTRDVEEPSKASTLSLEARSKTIWEGFR